MKFVLLLICMIYLGAMAYLYFFQSSIVFNASAIEPKEPFVLEDVKKVTLKTDADVVLDGVYKKSKYEQAPLMIYFGGNADDATRFLLHVRNLEAYDIVSFNYRGYVNSTGKPSQEALFSDAKKIYDTYAKEKEVIVIGRSLGTGVATYLATKREVKGVILITPYDSIASIAKKKYPIFPIDYLLKHKFESAKYIVNVKAPIGLIEVKDDSVVTKYHFDKLKENIQNLALHVSLSETTHGEVLTHKDFEKSIKNIIERM